MKLVGYVLISYLGVKFTPEQDTKAQMWSRGLALLLL